MNQESIEYLQSLTCEYVKIKNEEDNKKDDEGLEYKSSNSDKSEQSEKNALQKAFDKN